jgi:hypothetical protein
MALGKAPKWVRVIRPHATPLFRGGARKGTMAEIIRCDAPRYTLHRHGVGLHRSPHGARLHGIGQRHAHSHGACLCPSCAYSSSARSVFFVAAPARRCTERCLESRASVVGAASTRRKLMAPTVSARATRVSRARCSTQPGAAGRDLVEHDRKCGPGKHDRR